MNRELLIREHAATINGMAAEMGVALVNMRALTRMDNEAAIRRLYSKLSEISVAAGGAAIQHRLPFRDWATALAALALTIAAVRALIDDEQPDPVWRVSGLAPHNWDDVAVSANGNLLVAVQYAADDFSSKGKLFTSDDQGEIWTENAAAGERYYSSVAVSQDGQIIFATSYNETGGYGGGDDGALIRSTDGGETWNEIAVDAEDHRWETVSISADGQTVVLCEYSKSDFSLSGSVWISTTGGGNGSFTQKLSTQYWQRAAVSGDGQKIIVVSFTRIAAANGVGGEIHISEDGGANFAQATGDPEDRYQWCDVSADGSLFAVAGYLTSGGASFPSNIYLSDDGNAWAPVAFLGNQRWNSVAISADGSRLVAASQMNPPDYGDIYYSDDRGSEESWVHFAAQSNTYFLGADISGDGSLAVAAYYSDESDIIILELDA